jgi:RimJ/RimL family protein N-acetyltransferase
VRTEPIIETTGAPQAVGGWRPHLTGSRSAREGTTVGPVYLTGERLTIRALVKDDAAAAIAWWPGALPTNAPVAETWLKEHHKAAWWPADPLYLAIAEAADGRPVGGVEIEHPQDRIALLRLWIAPSFAPDETDRLQAEALTLLVRWLRDEVEAWVVTVPIPADCPATLAAAEALGMVRSTRLREFVARPGRRVDLLEHQALNPPRVAALATDPEEPGA